jgi:Fe-S-cluster-containing dehydrogenase component/DMSO reductase anchor subunit
MKLPLATDSPQAVPVAGPTRTLIDALLAEQRELTAVEEFARTHERHEITEPRYRALLPAAEPGPGQQYAFEVDLDQCSGCKACVTACHSLNGLDDDETWRSVGRLTSTDWRAPLQQVVTTSCHHCVDPACLNGCPVLAYDKDPVTGIVRHLDDQCIGCQYCAMMCPYDVPHYSKARGIVRKCDMCSSRLAVGEAPACVQACPNEAIRISVVEQAKVRGRYRELPMLGGTERGQIVPASNAFLPDSPNPAITLPATRYISQRALPTDLKAVDANEVRPAKAQPPLTVMLVLSQLGAGLALMDALTGGGSRGMGVVAVAVTALGVAIGALHLGQPLKAWRSFLGWRKSWLSRELIAFGAFLGALGAHLAIGHPLSAMLAALAGLLAVACSAMVYVATRRPFWNAPMTFAKFFGTALLLGGAGALLLSALGAAPTVPQNQVVALAVLGAAFKLAVELRILRFLGSRHGFISAHRDHEPERGSRTGCQPVSPGILPGEGTGAGSPGDRLEACPTIQGLTRGERAPLLTALKKSALLLNGPFGPLARARVMCAIMGGVVLPVMMLVGAPIVGLAALAFGFCLVGELIERHLFFVAEVAPKMPGGHGL